jgi:hypothetical protein
MAVVSTEAEPLDFARGRLSEARRRDLLSTSSGWLLNQGPSTQRGVYPEELRGAPVGTTDGGVMGVVALLRHSAPLPSSIAIVPRV